MLEELNKKHSLGITIPDISEHVFYTPQLVPSITKKYPPRISESIEEDGGPKNAKDTSEPSEIDKMVSILIKAGNESYNPSEQVAILVILERIKENLNPSLEIPDFSAYIPPKRRSVGYSRPVPLNLEIWERIVDGAIKKARNNKK